MAIELFKTIKKLLPKGTAFQSFYGTDWYNFLDGLSVEPKRIADFFEEVRDSGIPGSIPLEALDEWEEFLYLSNNPLLSVQERNDRIESKIAQVGGGGPDYIEEILETEFDKDLEIVENLTSSFSPFAGPTMGQPTATCGSGITCAKLSPNGLLIVGPPVYFTDKLYDVTCNVLTTCEGSQPSGGAMTCGRYSGVNVSEVEYELPTDTSLWPFIWFITGPLGLNDFFDLPIDRREDLIRTVISLKPANTWVIVQVNFI